jgi:uncharacterized membrane protein YjjP (DUF1212 family)
MPVQESKFLFVLGFIFLVSGIILYFLSTDSFTFLIALTYGIFGLIFDSYNEHSKVS